jgi:NADH dehydrogenase (ubiquinone) Fe-S protein 5
MQILRTKTIQDEAHKQKEKRAKEAAASKKKADSAAASNVPRLNVVEDKAKATA